MGFIFETRCLLHGVHFWNLFLLIIRWGSALHPEQKRSIAAAHVRFKSRI